LCSAVRSLGPRIGSTVSSQETCILTGPRGLGQAVPASQIVASTGYPVNHLADRQCRARLRRHARIRQRGDQRYRLSFRDRQWRSPRQPSLGLQVGFSPVPSLCCPFPTFGILSLHSHTISHIPRPARPSGLDRITFARLRAGDRSVLFHRPETLSGRSLLGEP
jgi:hypothetical protein